MRIIDQHAAWLEKIPSIIAGDLNLIPNGPEDRGSRGLGRLHDQLRELGYTSAYHHLSREAYGSETQPTYFHNWQSGAGFHIDHCFVHGSLLSGLRALTVGRFEDWVGRSGSRGGYSDHVPTIIDLDLPIAWDRATARDDQPELGPSS